MNYNCSTKCFSKEYEDLAKVTILTEGWRWERSLSRKFTQRS